MTTSADFPIGTRVRFKPTNVSPPWEGTVTAHVNTEQVECDRAGSIPVAMIEAVPDDPLLEVMEMQATVIDEQARAAARTVDLLETYLMRLVGERRPKALADADLRELVMHVRGGSL